VTTHALVQRLLAARSDLRCAHDRAALDGCDALTNLMTPTTKHPLPSAAPTAPGSALSTTTTTEEGASTPTNHAAHPVDLPPHPTFPPNPGAVRTAPGPTDLTQETTRPERPRPHHQVHQPTTSIPGTAPTAPGPTTQTTISQPPKGGSTTTIKKSKNRIQPTEADGEM
jgi:hypothetical protein